MQRPWLLALVAPFLLGGCQSIISTEVSVRADGAADVVASVEFRGDVAERLAEDTELRTELEDTLRLRTPALEVVEPGVQYRSKLDAAAIAANADVTGIAGIAVGLDGERATVTIATTRPTALEAAIIDSVATEPDRDALVKTIAENTFLRIEVHFPGAVVTADAGVEDGTAVVYAESLADWPTGTLTATGSTERDRTWWPWFVLAALALLVGGAVRRRR